MAAPAKPRRGRPPNPLDPSASHAARLGAEIRAHRLKRGLTLQVLGDLIGYTPQYISEVERAKTPPTQPFFTACDAALDAHGALLDLLPAALRERDRDRQERTAARRTARDLAALRCEAHSDAGDDVQPTNRRGLIGTAGAGALGLSVITSAPTVASGVDPDLPGHLLALLAIVGQHDALFGPRTVLDIVRHELRLIAEYRDTARGELRIALMRVEARWAEFGAWLAHDCGDERSRDALLDHALYLARESDYADLIAWARARQAQWVDAPRALRLAETGMHTPHASPQSRAWCAARAAHAHARIGDPDAAQRALAEVAQLVELDSPPPPRVVDRHIEPRHLRAWEARCWMTLDPRKAVPMYEALLRDWPLERHRDGGLHRARMALACANAGELDRARAEGRKAFAIAKRTGSAVAHAELRRLTAALRAA
jgi:transcriptional regulator with XRE-family HTH domain